ncbi:2-keto-4-pentenoate hydratase/2-oxohepta-3-ene-1,7-dioic acid hydratase (catechol pathway) [Nocardia amikacinitolerans]|uniref:fumarylacetoacetate hydrolase family protein n=1 Tax=Nocardia amikacinitolerans TaxID=756689 RepID=UPI000AEFEF81|nr:fumarylacetoacetate hydrolase family protein [Nocardia amikacinitolerans]MCP2320130.1 2-keto-4-pentenoate hydratase/2-oxohepta-3-ene-1,7-dioic acid hydratase (catechol pathway) [Nocardia amikacinitolerans]
MKLTRIRTSDGSVRVGIVESDGIHLLADLDDILLLLGHPTLSLAEAARAAGTTGEIMNPAEVQYLSPIATPPTIRDFYAFEQHVRAGRAWRGLDMDPEWYRIPVFYFSNPYAATGCGEISIPPGCEQFDFELEVGAIIGGHGSDLTPDRAEDLIAGFCILNDWSARDLQKREMTLSMGPVKGKDTATGLGPWIVTPDELAAHKEGTGYRLAMRCEVNGKKYTEAVWSDVYWSFAEMIAYASRGTEVRPGDIIGSGTCGTGCINELSRTHSPEEYPFLSPGDIVTATIEGLGVLENRIVAGAPARPLRPGTI